MDRWKALRILFTVACFVLFFFNSFQNAKQYFDHARTTTAKLQRRETARLPVITVCNYTGFKQNGSFAKTSDYLANTINPEDIFEMPLPELTPIYSRFLGRCYSHQSQERVINEEWSKPLRIRKDPMLRVFIHPRGHEMGHYFNYWPDPVPEHEFLADTATLDIQVVKNIFIKDHSCRDKDYTEHYRLTSKIQTLHLS